MHLFLEKKIAKPKRYIWEQENYNENNDVFLQHFDENGNFIENKEDKVEEELPQINYIFKKKDKD